MYFLIYNKDSELKCETFEETDEGREAFYLKCHEVIEKKYLVCAAIKGELMQDITLKLPYFTHF